MWAYVQEKGFDVFEQDQQNHTIKQAFFFDPDGMSATLIPLLRLVMKLRTSVGTALMRQAFFDDALGCNEIKPKR